MECNGSTIKTETGVKAPKCKYIVVPNTGQLENHLGWQK